MQSAMSSHTCPSVSTLLPHPSMVENSVLSRGNVCSCRVRFFQP
uniref:Uncharacterized protein n=1 Tax=Anguilla anguilla TaxID=7936 RepID=A0A0E9RHF8_ANGAN